MNHQERESSLEGNQQRPLLSRSECTVLRGLAILGIFMHNYCHWLKFAVKENEYTYTQGKVDHLWQILSAPDEFLPIHLVSFFGHYGVPVFLFLSAYGLVMKYESRQRPLQPSPSSGAIPFIRYHYLKLFKMMIVGYVAFQLIDPLTPGQHYYRVVDIFGQLLMYNNLMPSPDYVIWPGPFWFFGLMLQFYIVYRLLLYRRHWGWTVALMLACTLAQICFAPEGEALNRYRYNFMGGMLPFGLGLLYARHGKTLGLVIENKIQAAAGVILLTALLLFLSGNYYTWMWVPAVVCGLSVAFVKLLSSPRRWWAWLYVSLEWVGSISAAAFVMHPMTRKIFIPISHHGAVYQGLLLYLIATLAVAWLCRELMRKIPDPSQPHL